MLSFSSLDCGFGTRIQLFECSAKSPSEAKSNPARRAQNVLPVPGGPYRMTCPFRSKID